MKLRTRTRSPRRGARVGIAAATTLATVAALAACGVGGTGGASADADTLTVVVEGGGKAELQPIADLYKEETGTTVTLVELPYAGLYDRISTELGSGSPTFDVAALDAIWLSAFADGVSPLDDLYTDEVKDDLFGGLVTEAQVNGAYVGMPVWTNSEILFYRTDLFEDPANQADFEAKYGYPLAPPADWEQYRDVAEFFTRDTDGDGQVDLYGTDVKGAVETEWLATVSQAGEEHMVLDAESGEVTIADAEHQEALDFYTSLLPFAPTGAAQLDWAGAQNLFYQGKLAMMRFWGHAYRGTPDDSVVKDAIGVAPMIAGPGGVAGVPGAWYLSVPRAGAKQDEAKAFIAVRLRAQRPVGRHVARARRAQVRIRGEERRGRLRELPGPARHAERTADPSPPGDAGVAGDRRLGAHADAAEGRRAGRGQRRPARGGQVADRSDPPVTRRTTTARTSPWQAPPSTPRSGRSTRPPRPGRPVRPGGRARHPIDGVARRVGAGTSATGASRSR